MRRLGNRLSAIHATPILIELAAEASVMNRSHDASADRAGN